MRILLDEQLPRQLAPYLVGHEARTVQQESWAGLKNGALLTQAEAAGFSVFLTGDQNLEFQQNISKRRLDDQSWERLVAFLNELREFAHYYACLLRPENEPNAAIRLRLQRLNRMEATVAYPFLLNIYNEYANKRIVETDFTAVLDAIENFLVRRYVCRFARAELNKMFPSLFRLARLQRDLVVGTRTILSRRGYPRDADFRENLASMELYSTGGRGERAKFILERFEESLGHSEHVDFEELTIEHIMPQTLTDWWRDHLGSDFAEVHQKWLHTVGNLTLTGYNATSQMTPFPTSVRCTVTATSN